MKTKRIASLILTVALIAVSTALVACVDKPAAKQLTELTLPELKTNQMAVIIKNGGNDYTSYTVTLSADIKTGEDVIQYLIEEASLSVDWTDSEHGKYINSLGSLKPDVSKKEYINVLTSVAKDKGVWAGVKSYTVGKVTLTESQVGISDMTAEAGAIIYFEIASY